METEYPHIKQYNYRNYEINIYVDEHSESPRKWVPLGNIVTVENRYLDIREGNLDLDDVKQLNPDEYIVLPIYAYIHGGITIRTTPFTCPWDSGQIGVIYCSKGSYGYSDSDIIEFLTIEIRELDRWLNNDVYRYSISDADGSFIHSCCGFYGLSDCTNEAELTVDRHIKKHPEQLKLF